MRDIKFRAWDIKNKKMVQVDFLTRLVSKGYLKTIVTDDEKTLLEGEFELMQYTGLPDKNGVEICQGDILQGHGNKDDLVKVMFGEFNVIDVETLEVMEKVIGWYTEVIPTDGISKMEPFCLSMPLTEYYITRSEFEIIGNIYTNPELLEPR